MIRRLLLRAVLRLLVLGVLVTAIWTAWLLGSDSGARVAVAWISGLTPNVKLRHESGALFGTLTLDLVEIKTRRTKYVVRHATVAWSPSCLLLLEVCINDAHVRRLALVQSPAPAKPAPVVMPAVKLPVTLDVANLVVDSFEIQRGDKITRFTDNHAAFNWAGDSLRVDRVSIGQEGWVAAAAGTLTTRDDWPLTATASLQVPRSGDMRFRLAGTADGSLIDTHLDLHTAGHIDAHLQGHVQTMERGLPFRATGDAAVAHVPPRAAEPLATVTGLHVEGNGLLLGDFRLVARGEVATPWTPPLPATAEGVADWRGIREATLNIHSRPLRADARFAFEWLGGFRWHGDAHVAFLDLAMVNPAAPSRLAGTLSFDGELSNAQNVARFDVKRLDGTFRQWPVTGSGRLRWQDALWHLEPFDLRQQENLVHITGTMDTQWHASATLDLRNLQTIVPAFEGRATGKATIAGARTDPSFAFTLEAADVLLPAVTLPAPVPRTLRLPAADWRVRGTMTLGDVQIDEAITTRGPFDMTARGSVGWSPLLRWDLDTHVGRLALAALAPELAGRVDGPFASRGEMDDNLRALSVKTALSGTLDARPLAVAADGDWVPGRLDVRLLQLDHGDNHLKASGLLDAEALALELDIDAPDLAASFRDAAGRATVRASLSGPRRKPDADITVAGNALRWRDWQVSGLDGRLVLDEGGDRDLLLRLATRGVTDGSLPAIDMAGTVSGRRGDHLVDIALRQRDIALSLGGHGALDADDHWQGTLTAGSAVFRRDQWKAMADTALAWDGRQFRIDPHCWSDGTARACITAPAHIGHDGDLQAEVFHVALSDLLGDLLPIDTSIGGRVGGTVAAQWKDDMLEDLDVDLRNEAPLTLGLAGDAGERRQIGAFHTLSARAHLDPQGAQVQAALTGEKLGSVRIDAHIDPPQKNLALSGTLRVSKLDAALAEAFSYQIRRVGGTFDANLLLGGTLTAPTATGAFRIDDGRFNLTRRPVTFEAIDIAGNFSGNHLSFEGAFRTPDSKSLSQLDGRFEYVRGSWAGNATLRGRDLVIALPPEYQFTTAPDLTLTLADRIWHVGGMVRVPSGRIELDRLPVQSVAISRDVIVVHAGSQAGEHRFPFRYDADVHFALGDDVHYKAFGSVGLLTGDLRVRSSPMVPLAVDGELHLIDSKYTAYGQQLTVRRGDLIFRGLPDQPLIDAEAYRDISDPSVREVGLRLSGSARNPQSVLYSVPDMPQDQALVWLVTGRAPATGTSAGGQVLRGEAAQAALALGVAQGSALASAAGQEIGLQDVQLATSGEGETAEVQVGTNVNERVFVGYNRRVFTGEESVLLRLQMTRRLMLEALSGIESAIDVFYTFEF